MQIQRVRPPDRVDVLDLFAKDRTALLKLLAGLDDNEWGRPTTCAGWSVKDVAAHILGGDLGNLSSRRDGYTGGAPAHGEDVVSVVNRLNAAWVQATVQISPRVLCEQLAVVGPPLFEYFASLDLSSLGPAVSWAGLWPAPVWLDVAREYTERWHHQQHIRDAVRQPGQTTARFMSPVLATFAHALPVALRAVDAPVGTAVHLQVQGDAGGDWTVAREQVDWHLYLGVPAAATARVGLDPDPLWRLYTKGITPQEALSKATFAGDRHLARKLLDAVAIIA